MCTVKLNALEAYSGRHLKNHNYIWDNIFLNNLLNNVTSLTMFGN
jgi:hypothetical protein